MSVSIEIKQYGNEKINITVEEIAALKNLKYGIMDSYYTLEEGKTGRYTILYDRKRPGRGFEVTVENGDVSLYLPLPDSPYEIELFYSLVEKICYKLCTGYFYRDDETVTIDHVYDYIEQDINTSEYAIRTFAQKIRSGESDSIVLFGVFNPITIGINELNEIGGTIDGFEKYLARIQSIDAFYSNPKFYKRKNDTVFGMYFVGENIATVLPHKPYVPFNSIDNLDSFFVRIPEYNDIPYDAFMANIRVAEYYDHNHIIVNLDEATICEISDKYTVDTTTGKPRQAIYFGRILDNGKRHSSKVKNMDLDTEEINGFNHLAVFLRWACEHGLLGERLLKLIPQLPDLIKDPNIDMRIIIQNEPAFGGCLQVLHFNEKCRKFAEKFYVFNKDGFPSCVDMYAENVLGTEKYNCEEYKDEAYLFVPYNEEYYQGLSKYIDKAWDEFNNN